MASKTYKLNETTINTLQDISKELGLSWDGTFVTLANLYAQEKAIATVPDRRNELEHFQSIINQLLEAYTCTLTYNSNTEEKIKQEYTKKIAKLEARIELLDKTIKDDAESLKVTTEAYIAAKHRVDELIQENAHLMAQLQEKEDMVNLKGEINKILDEIKKNKK